MPSPPPATHDSADRDAEIAALFDRLSAMSGPPPDDSEASDRALPDLPTEDTALIDIRRLARSYSEGEPPLEDDPYDWDPRAIPAADLTVVTDAVLRSIPSRSDPAPVLLRRLIAAAIALGAATTLLAIVAIYAAMV